MTDIYIETVDLDKDKPDEEPTAKDDSAAIKDADKETADEVPSVDKKLDLLGGLGVGVLRLLGRLTGVDLRLLDRLVDRLDVDFRHRLPLP